MTTNQLKSIAEHVADYRKQYGWKLFPVTKGKKSPRIRGIDIAWKEDYIHKEKEFEEFPGDHGLGFASGEPSNDTAVIDFDSWEFFVKCAGDRLRELLAMTRVDRTPRGIHIFGHGKNIVERKIEVPNSEHKLEIFFGQFIDLPPTKGYETISTTKKIANFKDINLLISYVCDIVGADDSGKNKTGLTMDIVNDPTKILEGSRNEACFVYTRSLLNPLERGLSITEARGALQLYNSKLAGGELGSKELEVIFKSAIKNHNDETTNKTKDNRAEHEKLGDQLMEMRVFKTNHDNDIMYVRDEGVFVPRGLTVISKLSRELKSGLKKQQIAEIVDYIKSQTFIDMTLFDSFPNHINFPNGVFDITTDHFYTSQERDLERDRFLFLKKFETNYNSKAKCPRIMKFLEEILPDKPKREKVLERLALCLIPLKTHGKFIVFLGEPDSAKSAVFNLLRFTLGTKGFSSAILQDLISKDFALEQLEGKSVNISGDLPKMSISDMGQIKDLPEGNPVSVNPKGKKMYNTSFKMVFFVISNTAISIDDTEATWKRFEVFSFDVKIPKDRQIEGLGETLAKEEGEGFIQLLLSYAKKVYANGLSNVLGWEETKRNWVVRKDRIKETVTYALEKADKEKVSHKQIHTAFLIVMDRVNKELEANGLQKQEEIPLDKFVKRLHFECPELAEIAKRNKVGKDNLYFYYGWKVKEGYVIRITNPQKKL